MGGQMVLVADSSRARLFEMRGPEGALHEVEDFTHPHARLHGRDITTDKPGRSFDSAGQGRHSMEPRTDAVRVEAEAFARRLAERLDDARTRHGAEGFVVVAPPRFLGMLRGALGDATRDRVVAEIAKDLVTADRDRLAAEIRAAGR